MITLKATLVTAPDELRAGLEPLTDFRLVQACAALVVVPGPNELAALVRPPKEAPQPVRDAWRAYERTLDALVRVSSRIGPTVLRGGLQWWSQQEVSSGPGGTAEGGLLESATPGSHEVGH